MKRKLLVLMHSIAVKFMTYHSKKLCNWKQFDNKVCSHFERGEKYYE